MNWKLFTRSPRSTKNQTAVQPTRFRPSLDFLEDRTLLALAVFAIDPGSSSLALSGDVAGAAIQQQAPGSLITTYEGQVDVDFDLDANTISFLDDGSSGASADISGNWRPNINGGSGSAPANYGGQVSFLGTGLAAVRDAVANASTDNPLTLTPDGMGGYAFASTQTLTVVQGAVDYTHPLGGSGRLDISNRSAQNSAGPGNLQDNGDGTFTLTVPVDITLTVTISGFTAHLRVTGSITGNGGYVGPTPGGSGTTIDFAAAVAQGSGAGIAGSAFVSGDLTNLGDFSSARLQTPAGDTQVGHTQEQNFRSDTTALPAGQSGSTVSADQLLAIDTVGIEMGRSEGMTF